MNKNDKLNDSVASQKNNAQRYGKKTTRKGYSSNIKFYKV